MDTLNFLQRVLPSEGHYCALVINPDGRRQGFFKTVDELAKAIKSLNDRGNNTYYAIAAYKDGTNRKQDNVRALKTFALDIDCGEDKPYTTWKDGLTALLTFVKTMKLPDPMVVSSGNGLHVYWTLTRELETAEWLPIATAIKGAVAANGFEVDMTVPADSARVLRPVGTINPKGGMEVKLLIDRPAVDPDVIKQCVSAYAQAQPVSPPSNTRTNSLLDSLAVKQEFPPAIATAVANKCQQIRWGVDNQADAEEPFWYAMIGVAAHCENPEEVAVAWSQHHPAFSEHATISKLSHWKQSTTGPATCSRFESLRPDGCKGCKFKDKIGSPARLGVQYQAEEIATVAPDKVASEVQIPVPFKHVNGTIKMTLDESDIDISPFTIYPVGYGKDESLGYETVRYKWNRPHSGWQDLVLRQAYLTDGHREFATAIADQGIVLKGKKQTEFFQLMLRAYMDELRQIRSMTNLFSTMGWKENNTQFVIGDDLLKKDATGAVTHESVSLSSSSQRVGDSLYTISGSVESWKPITGILQRASMPIHIFMLGVSFSAPMYAFTGLKGLTFSLFGQTGGGKTLAQYLMQSVWGNPDKLHFQAKFTQNTLFSRMGLYCHLPMTIDEATMISDKEAGDFLYWVSQGRDKARLNRNAEERDAKTWATPTVISTNKSWQSKLIASGLDTDAQMARLLELNVDPHPLFISSSSAGKQIYQFVMDNHGAVGRDFIEILMGMGEQGIRAAIAEHSEEFYRKYKAKFAGSERFWEQGIILADLANKIAHQHGLVDYDYSAGTESVLAQIGAIRKSVVDNRLDAFDVLTNYLNECADSTVQVAHTVGQSPLVDHSRMPRNGIRVRFDLHRKTVADRFDTGTVMLDRTHFRKWLSTQGVDWKSVTTEFAAQNIVATPKSEKLFMGKDTPIKLGQSYVFGISLNHPRLHTILDDADEAVENITFGKLQAI
jgi:hypothetical protein